MWTLIAKVKQITVAALYRSSGEEGICVTGADARADRDRYGVVALPDTPAAEMGRAVTKGRRTAHTEGVIYALSSERLYLRCRHERLDEVRRAVLGDNQADRLKCAMYEISHVPQDLPVEYLTRVLKTSPGAFGDSACSIVEPVGPRRIDRRSKTYTYIYLVYRNPVIGITV